MRFDRIAIDNVRNIANADIHLSEGLNHFYGRNGAGKTAVLEAVHLLCRGRSFRSPLIRDIVRRDQDALVVRGEWRDVQLGKRSVGIQRSLTSGTSLRLDAQKVAKTSTIAQITPLQTLLPDVSDLVFGAPRERRNWLDWGMFHVKHDYLPLLRNFLRSLKQRNAVLRGDADRRMLATFTQEFVSLSEQVHETRSRYLAQLAPHLESILNSLLPDTEITYEYRRGWPEDDQLEKLLGERADREVKYGVSQWGPHRADLRFKVEQREAAKVLSRGQGKLLATSLKVAQVALLKQLQDKVSLFLIDDVGAELDEEHNAMFFRLLRDQGSQIISTSVQMLRADDFGFSAVETGMFHVKHGVVERRE